MVRRRRYSNRRSEEHTDAVWQLYIWMLGHASRRADHYYSLPPELDAQHQTAPKDVRT